MENPFVTELKRAFEDRALRNPRYSMRAFSRDLDVDPSVLSKILRGKRSVSGKMIRKVSQFLGHSPEQAQTFLDQNKAYLKRLRLLQADKNQQFVSIPLEQYEVISNWVHQAVLEALVLKDFDGTQEFLARKLGLAPVIISEAVERLSGLGILQVDSSGIVQSEKINTSSLGPKYTTEAMKTQQRELLKCSQQALDNVPFELRSHSSLVISIEKSKLPEFVEKIHAFRRDMNKFITKKSKSSDEVYCLALSFFPLTPVE